MRTAVVGAGLIGRAWAISFARAGHEVRIWDATPESAESALNYIGGILPELAAHGLLSSQSPPEVRARISIAADLGSAVADADYIQENTPERLDIKCDVFARLDEAAPRAAILASSTSALLPSTFTEHLAGRGRALTCHPINPPYLIPAVEVCPSPWTDPHVVQRAASFLRGCGQAPLVMKRELDGFIMNRMQGALLEEAFRLVESGVAGGEDIDIGIREGLALRWSFMGPFETIDLNAPGGIRDYAQRYEGIYANISQHAGPRAAWTGPVMDEIERDRRALLPSSALTERQAWRDRRLMALRAHKRDASESIGS